MSDWIHLCSFATFVIASGLFFHHTHGQSLSAEPCATKVHAILARGQAAKGEIGFDPLNVMASLQNLLLAQIPGSTSLALPYQYGAENKLVAVYDGARLLQDSIISYVATCPTARIVVVGYSLGACLTMDAICGTSSIGFIPVTALDRKYASNVIGVIAYGDETWVPLQSWNVGTCKIGLGLFPRLNPGSCEPFASSIHSYCDVGDSQW
ncbi:hypothetical protein F1880_004634 [Penicillium rolfsii]|nr:hypothetical protein F1880_004634 [Penicillium rolfsii]